MTCKGDRFQSKQSINVSNWRLTRRSWHLLRIHSEWLLQFLSALNEGNRSRIWRRLWKKFVGRQQIIDLPIIVLICHHHTWLFIFLDLHRWLAQALASLHAQSHIVYYSMLSDRGVDVWINNAGSSKRFPLMYRAMYSFRSLPTASLAWSGSLWVSGTMVRMTDLNTGCEKYICLWAAHTATLLHLSS